MIDNQAGILRDPKLASAFLGPLTPRPIDPPSGTPKFEDFNPALRLISGGSDVAMMAAASPRIPWLAPAPAAFTTTVKLPVVPGQRSSFKRQRDESGHLSDDEGVPEAVDAEED